MKKIPEEYIHYLWQYGLFDHSSLKTIDGEPISILKRGTLNLNSGPDFTGARILISDYEWVGNVEIHFKSSEWITHGHDKDQAYNNVILHVVVQHDKEVFNEKNLLLPTLSLSPYLTIDHFRNYEKFISNKAWVPCESQAHEVDSFKWLVLKERMAIERLTEKAERQLKLLDELHGDWEELAFRSIARTFGAKVNSEAFEQLASRTPFSMIRKHRDDRVLIEALLLGQAGYLTDGELFMDDYSSKQVRDYTFLSKKYSLSPMSRGNWKNSRIRPSSLPQIRIAQFSKLIAGCESLHSLILEATIDGLKEAFTTELDAYWTEHVGLGRPSTKRVKRVGASLCNRLLINTVVPIRFAYGLFTGEFRYRDSALSLLESLEVEDNRIVRAWNKIGVGADNAFDSQALIQLKSALCDLKKCLQCPIGQELLRTNAENVR